jgi:chromosome segregation ATPase
MNTTPTTKKEKSSPNSYRKLKTKVEMLRQNLEEADVTINELLKKLKEITIQYVELQKKTENDNNGIKKHNDDLEIINCNLSNKISNLQDEIIFLKEKNQNNKTPLLNNNIEKEKELKNEITTLHSEIVNYQNRIEILEKKNNELENLNVKIEKDNKLFHNKKENSDLTMEDELYILQYKNNISSLKEEIEELINKKNNLNSELFELKSFIRILENEKRDLESQEVIKKSRIRFCCCL